METLFVTHPACQQHDTGYGHPECAGRLQAIEERLAVTQLMDYLSYRRASPATDRQLLRVHTAELLARVHAPMPPEGYHHLDPDTRVSAGSARAARLAAGAVVEAVDAVISGQAQTAFCAVRPPGHHANAGAASGFCLFNNIAVGAYQALTHPDINRVAIVDFDVHHGNGTEDIVVDDPAILFCSTLQHPFYPNTPLRPMSDTMVSVPLKAGAGGDAFRAAVSEHWLPALSAFAPDLVMISAGFDGHRDDDMGGLALVDADYAWVTLQMRDIADRYAGGRMVSSLEGGYEFKSLARSVEQHIRVLARLEGIL